MSEVFETPDFLDLAGEDSREQGARSLTTAVYRRVRTDIIANRLSPGEKLHLATLQEHYSVSLSVVREALSRLVADGLVVAMAQRGFRVAPMSKKDLLDVTRARSEIEAVVVEMAIQNGNKAWLDSVGTSFERMCRQVEQSTDPATWSEAHAAFHYALVAPCQSPWLLRFRDTLFEQSERYRYSSVDPVHPPTPDQVREEHQPLLDAVLQRNSRKAKAAIKAHFNATLERVIAIKGLD